MKKKINFSFVEDDGLLRFERKSMAPEVLLFSISNIIEWLSFMFFSPYFARLPIITESLDFAVFKASMRVF
jgi:hypothetical protein